MQIDDKAVERDEARAQLVKARGEPVGETVTLTRTQIDGLLKAAYPLSTREERDRLVPDTPPAAEAVVKPLEWREVTRSRSDEDPTQEHTGDYEADTPFGPYYIEMYFGSDSYGWYVSFNGLKVADKDDPTLAQAAAQADYDARMLATRPAAPSDGGSRG